MPIQSDGFTKDPGGSGGGSFTPPTGSGFVKVTGGVLDTASSSLGATDILAAIAGIAINCGTSTGTANALAIASAVDVATSFTAGRFYLAKANLANSGATTAALNGGTGGSILPIRKNPNSAALVGGEIAANAWVLLYCDGTYLQLMAGRSLLPGDLGSGTPGANKFLDGLGAWRALVPGDIPPVLILRAKKTGSQVCASNAWTRLTFDTPGRNDGALTVGGTGNATFTSTVAGWMQIDMTIYGPSSISGLLAAYKNGAYETRGTASIDIGGIRLSTGMIVGIGDTVEIYLNCSGGTITPDVSTEPQQYLQIACLGRA